jgi:hypothetical protein
MEQTAEPLTPATGKPNQTDLLFMGSMVLVLLAVAWVGKLSYSEGMKTEVTKRNGEAMVKWLTQASPERGTADYQPAACATVQAAEAPSEETQVSTASAASGTASAAPTPRLWGECVKHLFTPPGPLAGLHNPFFEEPLQFVAKCEPSDRTLTGALVLEKLTPTPPGSPVPFVTSPLLDSDPIDQKMQLRVTVCDKGAYPIRIAEFEF